MSQKHDKQKNVNLFHTARRLGIKLLHTDSRRYQTLNPIQKFEVMHAQEAIIAASEAGLLLKSHLSGKVLDFGCGLGGGALVLSYNGANVTAIDIDSKPIEEFSKYNLIDSVKIIQGDGIAYMDNLPENSLDLVTAFIFGPDFEGSLIRRFFATANHAMKPKGRILITSETGTLSLVDRNCCDGCGHFVSRNVFVVKGFEKSKKGVRGDSKNTVY
jgi:SAM-dependent methyltransferase